MFKQINRSRMVLVVVGLLCPAIAFAQSGPTLGVNPMSICKEAFGPAVYRNQALGCYRQYTQNICKCVPWGPEPIDQPEQVNHIVEPGSHPGISNDVNEKFLADLERMERVSIGDARTEFGKDVAEFRENVERENASGD